VVDFITTHEAVKSLIDIADIEAKPLHSKNGDFLPTINARAEGENTEVQYKGLLALNDHTFERHDRFPLVKFTNGLHLLCAPLPFDVQGLKGNCEAQRVQVPLVLSWAMSIHKAQGQTMSRVKVDLKRIFEKGQGERLSSCLVVYAWKLICIWKHMSPFREPQAWKDWRSSVLTLQGLGSM
jgi:hypothetical protein